MSLFTSCSAPYGLSRNFNQSAYVMEGKNAKNYEVRTMPDGIYVVVADGKPCHDT